MFLRTLRTASTVNTDRQPLAYLYNIALWSEAHGGWWLKLAMENHTALMVLIGLSVPVIYLLLYLRGQATYPVVFSTGFMGISVVTLAALLYQAIEGFVYEMIGLIS